MSLRYRPEIDGLRTVAVISVLIYHAKFTVFGSDVLRGGFLGVDVFFVISGFLITSLIQQEWDRTGRFSVGSFYERRARRLLPALFIVIFASWPVAWFILMPGQMMDFVKSQIASVFFVSNMYWWDSALTYGGRSGLIEPFLHTWSLAVEEQFYILFPLVYICLMRFVTSRVTQMGLLLAGVVFGLVFAELITTRDWTLSFYWLPSRIWELLAGAALAHLLARAPDIWRSRFALRTMPVLGLVLVVAPMWVARVDWHHPGLVTVPAILGTVLIIWFANPRDPVTRLLSSGPFVAIGLISYSLYLWHYPIFAFGRLLEDQPGSGSKAVWFALSFGLAFLAYKLVETPFRNRARIPKGKLALSGAGAALLTLAFAAVMLGTDGMRDRFPTLVALYGQNDFDNDMLRDESWGPLNDLAAAQGFGPAEAHTPTAFDATQLWFQPPDDDRHRVLLVGNSHSKDMFNVFYLNEDRFPGMAFARFGMGANMRDGQIDTLLRSANFAAADTIVLSFRYEAPSLRALPAFLETLKVEGKQVILMLNTVEFEDIDGLPVFDWFLQDSEEPYSASAVNALAWDHRDPTGSEIYNPALRRIAAEAGVIALDKAEFICDAAARTCDVVGQTGDKSFFDYGHFTLAGARAFGVKIAEMGWFPLPPR